jgi:hypothetical protein
MLPTILMPMWKNCYFLGYIAGVFRGTRQLTLAEGRTIATILRSEYPKLFTDREKKPVGNKIKYGFRILIPNPEPLSGNNTASKHIPAKVMIQRM